MGASNLDRRSLIEGLGPATILAIMLMGSALSVYVWRDLQRQWNAQAEASAADFADRLRGTLSESVEDLHAELQRRARFWNSPTLRADLALWNVDAEAFLADNPSVLAVTGPRDEAQLVGLPASKQALLEAAPAIRAQQADPNGDFLSDPMRLATGAMVLGLQTAVTADDGTLHSVFALVDAGRLAEDAVSTRAPAAYGIVVTAGRDTLYRRQVAGDDVESWRKSEKVDLPFGRSWSVETWPSADSMPIPSQQGSLIALVGGLFASTLIAISLHFGTLAWRRERALRGINASLAEQVGETLRGQDELRQLSIELEARVAERTAELGETIVELETFNYSASHDLRGPLGAIINFAAILKEDYGDRIGDGVQHLDRIVNSATTAVSMMDALLAYSRSGRTELRRSEVRMGPLVSEVISDLSASSQCVDSNATIAGELPDAFADEDMIRGVLTNLIGNACKFVRPGEKPTIEIGGSVEGHEAVYFVRDQGVGFDMRFADKLFRVFERLHTQTDGYRGHGVGLAIVARVVRRHGGRIWAQSAEGRGATFYFTLPRVGAEVLDGHGRSPS